MLEIATKLSAKKTTMVAAVPAAAYALGKEPKVVAAAPMTSRT